MRVGTGSLVLLVGLVGAFGAPQDSTGSACGCSSRARPGFRNPACECFLDKSNGYLVDSLNSLIHLGSGAVLAGQTTKACACIPSSLQGFSNASCTCTASFVACPPNSEGHPTCLPSKGYNGVIIWDVTKEEYVVKLNNKVVSNVPVVDCPANSDGWPDCACNQGFSGLLSWNETVFDYVGQCKLEPCVANAGGAPKCACSKGFKEVETVQFSKNFQKWQGICSKVACPGHSLASTHPSCLCQFGYEGSTSWDDTLDQFIDKCSVANCPSHADSTVTDEGATCQCSLGFFDSDDDPVVFNSTSQKWLGKCTARECPVHSEGHPKCACSIGYLGNLAWNFSREDYDGRCTLAPCPAGASGTGCECLPGHVYVGSQGPVFSFGVGWTHQCRAVGCPVGSAGAPVTACKCQNPGFVGNLVWDNRTWGTCKEVACPLNSTSGKGNDGLLFCSCNIGFSGKVTWSDTDWTSTCTQVTCPDHASCLPSAQPRCEKGYFRNIFWNATDQTWVSNCERLECPAGSSGHPNCQCSIGFSGGDDQGNLGFLFAEENSKYLCRGNVACDSHCNLVACPSNADKTATGNCLCRRGYRGAVTWNRPVYDGDCTAVDCPGNCTEVSGGSCTCKKGFLPKGIDFVNQAWTGSCVYQDCGPNTENWPDCKCVYGAYFSDPNQPLNWSFDKGYQGSCSLVPCPADASGLGDCSCNKGFATFIDGRRVKAASFDRSTGKWLHKCVKEQCPTGSIGHPDCVCANGFSGNPITWTPSTGTYSKCVEVACEPESFYVRSDTNFSTQCICMDGFTGIVTWNSSLQDWQGDCTPTPCLGNIVCNRDKASCAKGYTGTVQYNKVYPQSWVANCATVPCPANSNGHPDCKCDRGYAGGMLSFDGVKYGTCTFVPCPAHSTRTADGQCPCDAFYQGNPTWDGTIYQGNCSLAPCVNGSKAKDDHVCKCEYGYKPNPVPSWSQPQQQWLGVCEPADCPDNSFAKKVNCSCNVGYRGTITYADFKFSGVCTRVDCPANSNGQNCDCNSGFFGIPSWNGTHWLHVCRSVQCPQNSTARVLSGNSGIACDCNDGYKGVVEWASTQYSSTCELVSCPLHGVAIPSLSSCTCDPGFTGQPTWSRSAQSYAGLCVPVACPKGTLISEKLATCVCPPGYTGDCKWTGTSYDCNCAIGDCPSNSAFSDALQLCTCNRGFAGVLTWVEEVDKYSGDCKKVDCIANATGAPSCACQVGFKGTPKWDDDKDIWTGVCSFVDCPEFSTGHPQCSCIFKYRPRSPLGWNAQSQSWEGACEPIPCPEHAGNNAPNCVCEKGYFPDGLAVQGVQYVGRCSPRKCPNDLGAFPNCNCTVGYAGYYQWDTTAFDYTGTCSSVDCPENSSGKLKCECNKGYSGTPAWDAQNQKWTHKCTQVACPTNSAGHPQCECTSGYRGTLTWDGPNQKYLGECEMVPCPDDSKRQAVKTNSSSLILGCDCYVGCVGGYAWLTSGYDGSCTCSKCPPNGNCKALEANFKLSQTVYPCSTGFSGQVTWDGKNWVDNCTAVKCPENSEQHPNCICSPGYAGVVTPNLAFDGKTTAFSYSSTCQEVPCPTGMDKTFSAERIPFCKCRVGFSGSATWVTQSQSFTNGTCVEVPCPDTKMSKNTDKSECACVVNFVGKSAWQSSSQTYVSKNCAIAQCPSGVDCKTDGTTKNCNQFYAGSFVWNPLVQSWDNNCSIVSCPRHSVKRAFVGGEPQGCDCTEGFSPVPQWLPPSQSFSGCENDAVCPKFADTTKADATTGGRLCSCLAGYVGQRVWQIDAAEYKHTCVQAPCPDGSARKENGLCDCMIGWNGTLDWNLNTQAYAGVCKPAPCGGAGVDCTKSTEPNSRKLATRLDCVPGFESHTFWNFTTQEWMNRCDWVECPVNTYRISTGECGCKFGFAGTVKWDPEAQDFAPACTVVTCPNPTNPTTDGHCQCPPATAQGKCDFLDDDTYACQCSALKECVKDSSGTVVCTCNVGYRGVLGFNTAVNVADKNSTSTYSTVTTRIGSCSLVECPPHSKDGTHPKCICESGYSGTITWMKDISAWNSTCDIAACPANAVGGPACSCAKGYLGSLAWNFDTQMWDGKCVLAACPANASHGFNGAVPTCACDNGFSGSQVWKAGEGWLHTCTYVACPVQSTKIATSNLSYAEIPLSIGCHSGDSNLGFISTADDVLGLSTPCRSAGECIQRGRDACETLASKNQECWGFAFSEQFGVEIYSSNAVNFEVCKTPFGLQPSTSFTTFKRLTVRRGDCRCNSGYHGGYTFDSTSYRGTCQKVACPSNSVCSNTVDCNQGFAGSDKFAWDFDFERWIGTCEMKACFSNTREGSFPNCQCDLGFAGQPKWNDVSEEWTGQCTAVPCPSNSEPFPTCKCVKGFLRNDGAANQAIGFDFVTQKWKQTCQEVKCPPFSRKTASQDCVCSQGYRGTPVFEMTSGQYVVENAVDNKFDSCARIACPANSNERTVNDNIACVCDKGYNGDLSWNPSTFQWGTCTAQECPTHSQGHPNCACDEGFLGDIQWDTDRYLGSCTQANVQPDWRDVEDEEIEQGSCIRLRGPKTALVTTNSNPTGLSFSFGCTGDDVAVLRCDIKLKDDFTQISGTYSVLPTSGNVNNNVKVTAYNSTAYSATAQAIVVGTIFDIADPGMEGGNKPLKYFSYRSPIAIPPTTVSQTNTIRFEVSQACGTKFTLKDLNLQVFALPPEAVNCSRTKQ